MGIELSKKSNKINLSGELLRGEPGGYYIPTVDLDGNITWEATNEKMPDVAAANIKGRDAIIGATPVYRVMGEDGFNELLERLKSSRALDIINFDIINDGDAFNITYSQHIVVTIKTGDIYTIGFNISAGVIMGALRVGNFVLEADGYIFRMWDDWEETEKLIPVLNGKQGETGETGADGKDGVSPVVSSVEIEGGHRLTILSYGKMITFDVMDGEPGAKGDTGATGAQGKKGDKGDTGDPGKDGEPGVDGVSVSKVEVDADNHLQITLSNGTKQDAGQIAVSGGGGSAGYELIRSFEVKEGDDVSGFAFGADDNGNEFSLRAICAFCYFPAATGAGTLEIGVKNPGGALKGIYKRSEMLNTSARWIKLDMELKGYWTGGSTINTTANGVNAVYEGHSRNTISNPAYYINIASNIKLPVGSTIEVYGVRA